MKKLRKYLLPLLVLSHICQAGMTIESSRVVFSASSRERSLMLANDNHYPVIVQTWVDNGDLKNTPETVDNVPVIPLPGVFRLEPQEKKNLRLLATYLPQATDRESLYWLNIYEIPPVEAKLPASLSAVKVAVRLQLKLFFRPENLSSSPDKVVEQQKIELQRMPGSLAIKISNPTPYFATYRSLNLTGEGSVQTLEPGMLSPFSAKTINKEVATQWKPQRATFELIDDDGNLIKGSRNF
ncbi:molecular chaperone [Citrobacter amalonaticus]|uniref:Molecular chaperone n=2 Tax=Citrobacter amalonaticus TaxID=35703 RepID=A0A2S4RS06_CITAM|nr:molecular chaperone [Citrobacter amalonaticus]POT73925.1 molecular chaperone [Citrobacter amalonaticus]POU62302.1 molecular chaperone [Citrobacter amalonaticus]POV02804.1 molecular chaperone [Citrobacter amalonaticus]